MSLGESIGRFLRTARSDRSVVVGMLITGVVVLAIPLGSLSPYGPEEIVGSPLAGPSWAHPFGTDGTGFDVATRILYAPRVDLAIAFAATSLAFLVGSLLGVVAGMLQGRRDVAGWAAEGIMRLLDIFQALPVFVLALALVAMVGPSPATVVAAIAFVNHPVFARLLRAEVLARRGSGYVEAAICSGNSPVRLAISHLLPNVFPTALVLFSVNLGFAILLTSGLSFVGAGVRIPTAEWGVMVSDGARDMVTGAWWTVVFPGMAIGASVFGFSYLGDGLRRVLTRASA